MEFFYSSEVKGYKKVKSSRNSEQPDEEEEEDNSRGCVRDLAFVSYCIIHLIIPLRGERTSERMNERLEGNSVGRKECECECRYECWCGCAILLFGWRRRPCCTKVAAQHIGC